MPFFPKFINKKKPLQDIKTLGSLSLEPSG
jgi:hypothetical protein